MNHSLPWASRDQLDILGIAAVGHSLDPNAFYEQAKQVIIACQQGGVLLKTRTGCVMAFDLQEYPVPSVLIWAMAKAGLLREIGRSRVMTSYGLCSI